MTLRWWEIADFSRSEMIMQWCLREHKVDRALVVVRMERLRGRWRAQVPQVDDNVERMFKGRIVDSFLASAWPGTKLLGPQARVYVFKFGSAELDAIVHTEPRLDKWQHTHDLGLPEDLCLFRDGDSAPVLISVTHETEGWLLTHREVRIPKVKLDTRHLESFVFEGKWFCTPAGMKPIHRRL